MDTISRENNSMLPVGAIIVGVIALLLGGYARYIAICPPSWKHGVRVGQVPEAPLQKYGSDLQWNTSLGYRTRP